MNYVYPRIASNGIELLFAAKSKLKKDKFHVSIFNMNNKKIIPIENLEVVSYNPSWSSDGKKIIFVNQATKDINSSSIYLVNKDGSNLKKIIECEGGCFQPRFSPNGKQIIYKNGWVKNHKGIYLFNLKKKTTTKLIGI